MMGKLQLFKIIKDTKRKLHKNTQVLKEINNFERNIEPFLCKKCKIKLRRVKGGNILTIAAKQRYFCKDCNNIISKKATEVFVGI